MLVAVAAAAAVAVAGRRATLASGIVLTSMGLEALSSLPTAVDLGTSSFLVLVTVVVLSGLLLGARAVVIASAAVLGLVPTTLALFGQIGPLYEGLTSRDASRLLIFELIVAGLGAMMWLAFRTFDRVRMAAEERYALEARLWHLQRLEIVGGMASGLAHQLKNVLAVTQSTAEFLRGQVDPDIREAGDDLREAVGRGTEWVRELLTMARREQPSGEEIDLASWVERFGRVAMQLLGGERRFELRCADPAPAWIDTTHLEQVVLNLLTNARDATALRGTVVLSVRPIEQREAAALGSSLEIPMQVLLEVSDNGPGVPPEVLPLLFEPFVTTKPRGKGTGLGLSTVRSIVQSWKGCVTAESRPGTGATFRVFLPRARMQALAGLA
jgi:signal transduction histidine kinase